MRVNTGLPSGVFQMPIINNKASKNSFIQRSLKYSVPFIKRKLQ